MEDALLGAMTGPEDELGAELFGPERGFTDGLALSPATGAAERDELPVLADAYLGATEPGEQLLRALSPSPGAEVPAALLGDFPGLPELRNPDDAAPPSAYSVHVLSSLLPGARGPALLPLSAGVRVIPVEIKEAGGSVPGSSPEDAAFQTPLAQESCCKFPSSQEAEEASGCPRKKDSSPMVICQLKGGAQMLCIDNCGTRELKALHLLPQYDDQNSFPQSDLPKPMTTLVGRLLPVPAKLNLITQVDNGALPSTVNGAAFPSGPAMQGPPKIALAGYCDCFASGDFCNSCSCNNLRHELERFKAIKACLDRNPEGFQPKMGKGRLGVSKLRHSKGCSCKRSGCLKNYCECYEARIMCSSICKCIACKNYEESPERKMLMNTPHYMEAGDFEGNHHLSPAMFSGPPKLRKTRQTFSCISWEVVEATCACLLAQGEEAEQEHCSPSLAEQMVLEEFGRCLSQILHIEFKSKGLKIE
ncbi:tesmin isoform X2 [Peromyscus maniculatus bairdii]|uniref:Testis expressed metallothionein like n=2 Tax=Peromyscus maniculatus bairdii TaxID=230844 RepID=A0A6I9LK29_PERMB|nr:tesmin isoform X1 [Peromyscus maniculatus bairdii]